VLINTLVKFRRSENRDAGKEHKVIKAS